MFFYYGQCLFQVTPCLIWPVQATFDHCDPMIDPPRLTWAKALSQIYGLFQHSFSLSVIIGTEKPAISMRGKGRRLSWTSWSAATRAHCFASSSRPNNADSLDAADATKYVPSVSKFGPSRKLS